VTPTCGTAAGLDERGPAAVWRRAVRGDGSAGELAPHRVGVHQVRHELELDVLDPLLGVLENLFHAFGRDGHEIVFVFDCRLADQSSTSGMPSVRYATTRARR